MYLSSESYSVIIEPLLDQKLFLTDAMNTFQESLSSTELPNNCQRILLSTSFTDDQGYHGSVFEQDGKHTADFLTLNMGCFSVFASSL